ncbi:MAG TPA: pilus assembly protein TadG-related protein [Caulobacteraceae bacterium]|jgi:Flp pilus assembly protein TadG
MPSKYDLSNMVRRIKNATRMFSDRRGNVALISCFMMVPLVFAFGMGVDYTLAKRRQDQINGIADAAALAAVTPSMMGQSDTNAIAAARSMFLAQIATVPDVGYSSGNVSVTASTTTGAVNKRTVTVNYTATSNNQFAALLGVSTLPIAGTSAATSSLAPNINFYLLLDTSPSMEIAATTAGMNTLIANTQKQVDSTTKVAGCAFGCHQSNPSADSLGNPSSTYNSKTNPNPITCVSGTSSSILTSVQTGGEDNYGLARCLGVTMRIDLVNQATQNLMSVAQTTQTQNKTVYQVAIYTFDQAINTTQSLTSNLTSAQTNAANIQPLQVYKNNWLTSSSNNQDEDTSLDTFMAQMYTANSTTNIMPTPGNGTNNKGDTPQEVLFIVSDGLNDNLVGGSRSYKPVSAATCAAIKNGGIRIAFLYLTYNPMTSNGWYNSYVAPIQSQIAPAAQSCASAGLYFQVNTDGDISSAMTALFQKAVATAYLSH